MGTPYLSLEWKFTIDEASKQKRILLIQKIVKRTIYNSKFLQDLGLGENGILARGSSSLVSLKTMAEVISRVFELWFL